MENFRLYTKRLSVARITKMSFEMLKIVLFFGPEKKTIDFPNFRLLFCNRENLSKHGFFSQKMWLIFLFFRYFCNAATLSVFKAVEMNEFFDWFQTTFWLTSNNFSADFKQWSANLKQFFRRVLVESVHEICVYVGAHCSFCTCIWLASFTREE